MSKEIENKNKREVDMMKYDMSKYDKTRDSVESEVV